MIYARDGGACGGVALGVPLLFCAAGSWEWGLPGVPTPIAVLGFALAGLTLLLLRVRLEVGGGSVDHVIQLGVVVRRRRTPLAAFDRIAVVVQRRDVDVLHLWLHGPQQKLHLETFIDAPSAREAAEALSRESGLPVEADDAVAAPARPSPAMPSPPPLTRLAAGVDAAGATFGIPAPPLGWRLALSLAVGGLLPGIFLVGAGFAWAGWMDPPPANPLGMARFLLVCGLVLLPPLVLPLLAAASRVEHVQVADGVVRLRWQTWITTGDRTVEAADLVEIRVEPSRSDNLRFLRPPGTVVALYTTKGREELGTGLPAPEIEWLREAIAHVLAGPPASPPPDPPAPADSAGPPAPRKTWKMPPP